MPVGINGKHVLLCWRSSGTGRPNDPTSYLPAGLWLDPLCAGRGCVLSPPRPAGIVKVLTQYQEVFCSLPLQPFPIGELEGWHGHVAGTVCL